MKIFHLSDLHIGKQLHYYDLRKLQEDVLHQIAERAAEYHPDAIVIAGDIYDKSVPSGEACELFDSFLNQLAAITPSIPVLMIAGNHDSAKRLKFASAFLEKNHIYIAAMPPRSQDEHLKRVTLADAYGEVHFYLLPFLKPGYVRSLFEEGKVTDYQSAVSAVLEREHIDFSQRNVLVAHQFFVSAGKGPETCDSELTYISVGGIDSVDVDCVRAFDYVALGHIHGAQRIGADHIRYSGTPLKYSVSEEHHKKAIQMVTLGEKGSASVYENIPLLPLREVRSIRGSMEEVIKAATDENRDDYVSITLTDDNVYRPRDLLEEHYSHILEVRIDNDRIRSALQAQDRTTDNPDPLESFAEFYQEMNGQPLSEEEARLMEEIIDEARYEYSHLDGE
jgi:exonuclease SbcD